MKRSLLAGLMLALLAAPGALRAADLYAEEAAPSRNEALLRSALWPGLGQIEQGRTGRGAAWAGGAVLLAVATFFSHTQYHSAALDFESSELGFQRAVAEGQRELAEGYLEDMAHFHGLAEDRRSYRTGLEVALIALWAGNLVDTWLFAREPAGEAAAALGGRPGGGAAADRSALTGRGRAASPGSGAWPGRVEPVLHGAAAGLAWTLAF